MARKPVTIYGIEPAIAALKNTAARTTRAARRQIEIEAEAVADLARMFVPVDLHNLEDSIEVSREIDSNRRKMMIVSAGGTVNGVNVDAYATAMHEGQYNLGPGSEAKQKALGVIVGPKYLARALEERRPIMEAAMAQAVRRSV